MIHGLDEVRRVADHELLSRLEQLVRADRALSLKLLVHLGEVEARKLFLERGYSSMYGYCMTVLGMSEAETYLRLLAAKTGKRFPLVLERLGEGGLHLTAIKLLAPLLTEENHVALLDRARGMSKRQLEVLVAKLAPQPDVPERVRKLPEFRGASTVSAQLAVGVDPSETVGGAVARVAAVGGCEVPVANAVHSSDAPHAGVAPTVSLYVSTAAAAPLSLQPPPRASTSPLSPGRFKLELTLGQEAHDQLQQLRELLRHQNPHGEITCIVERALRELLERTLKRRFAQTGSARALEDHSLRGVAETGARPTDSAGDRAASCDVSLTATPPQPETLAPVRAADADVVPLPRTAASSRYVPRAVLRAIYARDAGQCSYVSADGRRCCARGFLEVHHHLAFALGGAASFENLRLVCRAHNVWLAERELGRVFVQGKVAQARLRLFAAEPDGP
jgi:hypothetical protein